MRSYCKENLNEIIKLLLQLTPEQYSYPSSTLFGATIGQHVRHILEFYQSVVNSLESKKVNYDNRKRNLLIETDTLHAIQIIDDITSFLTIELLDEAYILEGNFCAHSNKQTQIVTSLFRELAYCLEHSIHHQALIKVGLLEIGKLNLIDENFGLAPTTIRFRKLVV